jgi:hypothetical protein
MNRKLVTFTLTACGAVLTPLFFGACATVGGSSVSLGSISSLSGSSMSAAAPVSYHYTEDVRVAAESAFAAGASESEVLRSVGRIAERHGISDWEAQPATYTAIGKALKVTCEDEQSALELATKLAGNNQSAIELLLQGYRHA